ncbi:hypothetical protein ABTW76_05400 [Paenibacillus dendritiformis]
MKKFFSHCKTKQEAKKVFRTLAKQYHPDKNETDTNDIMKVIIAEYEAIIKKLPSDAAGNSSGQQEGETNEAYKARISQEMQEIINDISHLPIDIEVIGTWIWVSGNTYPYKAYLTAHNFKWCAKKKMYAWHAEPKRRRYGSAKEIEEIRATYGTTKVKNKEYTYITA